MKYYLNRNGNKVGPFTPKELAEQNVVPLDLVCPEGSEKEVYASEVQELKPFVTTFEQDIANDKKRNLIEGIGGIVACAVIIALLVSFTTIPLTPILGVIGFFVAIAAIVRFSIVRYVAIGLGCVAIVLRPEMRTFVIGLIIGVAAILAVLTPIVLVKYLRYALTGIGGALLIFLMFAEGAIMSVVSFIGVVAVLFVYAVIVNLIVFSVERSRSRQYAVR